MLLDNRKQVVVEPYWRKVIREQEEVGYFTVKHRNESSSWISCACGNLDPRIARVAPADRLLYNLGMDFYRAIQGNDFFTASCVLDAIEVREAELLAELEG